jgi:hypothetical protein
MAFFKLKWLDNWLHADFHTPKASKSLHAKCPKGMTVNSRAGRSAVVCVSLRLMNIFPNAPCAQQNRLDNDEK